jgi:class 3 adenylate cyclase
MDCPSCGAANPGGKRFCGGCGAALPLRCAACGADNPPGNKFCGDCGAALTTAAAAHPGRDPASQLAPPPAAQLPEGERRQVTVLFADLCGYTRLSGELDAEEVHGLLSRFFETVDSVIQSYGGRIDKHIGDCVMGVFGAPLAHGDDPERAVRAPFATRCRRCASTSASRPARWSPAGSASGAGARTASPAIPSTSPRA